MPRAKGRPDLNTIGGRLRFAREQRDLTQQDVAEACGVSGQAVSAWERGDTKQLRPENLFAVAELTRFWPRWLAIKDGPERMPPISRQNRNRILAAITDIPETSVSQVIRVLEALQQTK
jgi:transcriptional regulator with XRE-family HTH domain